MQALERWAPWIISAGREMSPLEHDICFVPIDSAGSPGPLNSYVLRRLGIPTSALPSGEDLINGYARINTNPTVVCIVTIASENPHQLLARNLSRALEEILSESAQPERIWLPLMGTGSGGLAPELSLRISLNVLRKHRVAPPKRCHLTVSFGPDVQSRLGQNLQEQIKQFEEDITEQQQAFDEVDSGVRNKSSNSKQSRLSRDFTDDLPTFTDAPPIEPKLNFPHIAKSIAQLVEEVTTSTDPASATVMQGSDRLWITAKDARLTIGLYAPWGSGKSTLINALREQFIKDKYKVFFINPWRWDGQGSLHGYVRRLVLEQASAQEGKRRLIWYVSVREWFHANGYRLCWLIAAISLLIFFRNEIAAMFVISSRNGASPQSSDGGELRWLLLLPVIGALLSKWFGDRLGRLLDQLFVGTVPDKLGADGLSKTYKDISRLIGRQGAFRPFVFFFDDLDRCQPERIVSVLESVHSLTSTGCVVFIACDDKFVSASIAVHFEKLVKALPNGGMDFGVRFLEKIVQVAFRLPHVRNQDIYELGLATISPIQSTSGAPASPTVTPPHMRSSPSKQDAPNDSETTLNSIKLREIISQLLGETIEPLGLNIRQVKSITNTMKLYLEIDATSDDVSATRLAAFVLANVCDPDWLDAHYSGRKPNDGPIGNAPVVSAKLAEALGDDSSTLAALYHLLGRRPPAHNTKQP